MFCHIFLVKKQKGRCIEGETLLRKKVDDHLQCFLLGICSCSQMATYWKLNRYKKFKLFFLLFFFTSCTSVNWNDLFIFSAKNFTKVKKLNWLHIPIFWEKITKFHFFLKFQNSFATFLSTQILIWGIFLKQLFTFWTGFRNMSPFNAKSSWNAHNWCNIRKLGSQRKQKQQQWIETLKKKITSFFEF